MTTELTILDVIADLMKDLPAPARRELHVAEPVWRFLRDRYVPIIRPEAAARLMEMPVLVSDDLTGGQWQIRENGEVTSSGDMAPAPEGMTVAYSPQFGWFAVASHLAEETR